MPVVTLHAVSWQVIELSCMRTVHQFPFMNGSFHWLLEPFVHLAMLAAFPVVLLAYNLFAI